MGIRTITLYEVPKEIRAVGAASARRQLQLLLNNPQLTSEQRRELQDQLKWISRWERLDIENVVPRFAKPVEPVLAAPPPAPPAQAEAQREPQHHTIEVTESLSVTEH